MDDEKLKKAAQELEKKRLQEEERLKKEAAKPVQKQYYTVVLEVMAPVEMTFRVFAETPEDAAEMVSSGPLPPLYAAPRPIISKMKRVKATVYKAGTNIYYLVKNYRI